MPSALHLWPDTLAVSQNQRRYNAALQLNSNGESAEHLVLPINLTARTLSAALEVNHGNPQDARLNNC